MAPSRRNSNGRSPLVNQQRQITAFFTKSTSSPSPSPNLSKPNNNPKLSPNPTSSTSPSPSPPTPSPTNPKPNHHKPLILIGPSPSPSPSSSSHYAQDVIGRRIKVYWPLDKAWYEGTVKSFDNVTSKHLVVYEDDEEESLDLSKEKIEWIQESSSSVKKLKRLRRGVPAVRKMVIEDDEVDESPKGDDDGDDDDSSDEDWGKTAIVEDAEEEEEEEAAELEDEEEDDEDDVVERSKRKPSAKVFTKKRKMGGADKLEPAKKSKSVAEVGSVKGAFKISVLEPTSNSESE